MKITLRTIDLQVLLPRLDQTVRYQGREEQQGHLRHQFALQEQRLHSEKGRQVQTLPRGERGRLRTRQDKKDQRKRRFVFAKKGKRGTEEHHGREVDSLRGGRLDFRV